MSAKLLSVFTSAALTIGLTAGMSIGSVAVADVQIGALACQAPYLHQAARLRWHEHYLLNPPTSETTWVVCPIAFDSEFIPTDNEGGVRVGAFGVLAPSRIGVTPVCYANVVDLRNQHVPESNFSPNPGMKLIASFRMQSQTGLGGLTLWSSWTDITRAKVLAQMDDPPPTPVDPSGSSIGWAFWTVTINCELQPGHGVNVVSLYPTRVAQ